MQGKLLTKTILIVALIAWAVYALFPTYQLWTMDPEVRQEREVEGSLENLQGQAINLGLDLKGGMYLTLEVDLPDLIQRLADNKDAQFDELMQKTQEDLNVSTEDYLVLLRTNFEAATVPLHRYWGERDDSDNKILDYLQDQGKDAMDISLQKLRNRIDQFGVSEPSIQKVGGNRVLIQLPGVSNPDQAKRLIGKTALLEFSMLKDPIVFRQTIDKIDKALAKERGVAVVDEDIALESEEDSTEVTKEPKQSDDTALSVNELFGQDPAFVADDTATADTTILVDEELFQENPFIALLRSTSGGKHEVSAPLDNKGSIDRILAREDVQRLIPSDAVFLWSSETFKLGDKDYQGLYLVKKESEITGQHLTDARVEIGRDVQSAGMPEVNFTLDRSGARIFSRVTGANIDKRMAIVLDNKVVSAPRIQNKIPHGRSRITGIESMDEAKMISIVLRVGALPAQVRIIEERTVGASLGQDSVNAGRNSALVGLGLVIVFMIVYYGLSGFVANIALLLNLVLLMAVLAQFRFTLTLPGVAGIVLTIGMAVYANVLVFERIREELRTGKTVRASIDAGYGRAFRTILDANITTLLTALVLYQFGSGPVRGFAVTLSIGIVVSMFTALVVTRTIFDHITSRRTLKKLSI
ncbi:protein translocase subunit SecD [candidate division KSB1 bacterium]|nr:protein translocase subunit SecD [candidate division KSB1 bacterium]